MPREFIFLFIRYFIGRNCQKGIAKSGEIRKKMERDGYIGGGGVGGEVIYRKRGSNLLHTIESHKMIMAVMETTFGKLKPNVAHYRDYKKFCSDRYREYLYCDLETLISTEMALKNSYKCVASPWTTLHHVKKCERKQHIFHE